MRQMIARLRRVGIALGSFIAACLAESLLLGMLFGPRALQTPLFVPVALVSGALIYRDIMRHEAAAPDRAS